MLTAKTAGEINLEIRSGIGNVWQMFLSSNIQFIIAGFNDNVNHDNYNQIALFNIQKISEIIDDISNINIVDVETESEKHWTKLCIVISHYNSICIF